MSNRSRFEYNGNVYYNAQEEFDVTDYIAEVIEDVAVNGDVNDKNVLSKSKTLNAIASKSLSSKTKANLVATIVAMGLPNLAQAVNMSGEIATQHSFSQMVTGSLKNLMGFVVQTSSAVRGVGVAANKTTEVANELLSSITSWMVDAELLPKWVGHRIDIVGLFLMSIIIMGIVMKYNYHKYKVDRNFNKAAMQMQMQMQKEIFIEFIKKKKYSEDQLVRMLALADEGYKQHRQKN